MQGQTLHDHLIYLHPTPCCSIAARSYPAALADLLQASNMSGLAAKRPSIPAMDTKRSTSDFIEKRPGHGVVDSTEVDVAAQIVAGQDVEVNPADALRVRRKLDWHLMPLMCIMYMMQFADRSTLAQSAVLGLLQDDHLSQNQFDWLNTIFFLSFLAFQFPQNYALQRLPVGKWVSINIFIWAVALLCHTAAKDFATLFICRFFLGICEGAITPGFMIVTSMFYARQEQTRRVGYWYLMNGFAVIVLGLVAYGTLHIKSSVLEPWQWLMLITGIITLIVSVLFWLFFPDSITNAWFLTPEEKAIAVARIKVNQAGMENKHFKKEQMIECFKDPKTWFFFFSLTIESVTNSLSNQRQIIVAEFGFTDLQTTLLGCVDGVAEILWIILVITASSYWKNARAYAACAAYSAAILGSILVNALPSSDRVGLLFCYWISINQVAPIVIMLAWVGTVTAGHTKRVTTNAVVMIGYALGNAVGPQCWKAKYQPRNHVPWAIMTACWTTVAVLLLVTRWYLAHENARRDCEEHDATYDDVYITDVKTGTERKVDKAFLDLTDIQNRDFRYVL
ncbi:MFS general substrate transporter [Wolfiporia cocos MD-104 SS10]|uniref:MFS general substrate transporter n=1 Tax=Wolfiporia cocos (strain MD-104) TaxID=742152 RepID=A0A2H3JMC6_WOLCO|nr:MFS general substrate transporter [Wolfiporia cocos MD-104 SS10]